MSWKPLIAAAIAALIGAASLWLYIRRFETEATGGPRVRVLMTTRDVPAGASLSKDVLGIHEVPRAYVGERRVRARDLEQVVGVTTTLPLRANQSLLWTDLARMSRGRRALASLVEPGKRAVPLSPGGSALHALLRPGDRVDILFSRNDALTGDNGATLTLLQNVLVLAVGHATRRASGDSASHSRSRRGITVSATPEQSQLLTYAQRQGEIALTLRNHEDIVIVEGLPETSRRDLNDADRRARMSHRRVANAASERGIDHVR